ncbi:MAG: site-2 protease family protein, partial [Giesbergeria sp.]
HIDPVGTILMPLILFFATSGTFLFGYAKPVPVNFGALRNPKRDMVWVALAGPASNFIQAIAWAVLFLLLVGAGVREMFFLKMAHGGVLVNLLIGIFNLLPLPPLDGGRILVGLLPLKQARAVSRIEPFGFFIVMALALTGIVGTWWLLPLLRLGNGAIDVLLTPLTALMGLQLPPDMFIRPFP